MHGMQPRNIIHAISCHCKMSIVSFSFLLYMLYSLVLYYMTFLSFDYDLFLIQSAIYIYIYISFYQNDIENNG